MEVKASIINMPDSQLKDKQFDDWYQEYVNEWGGYGYKFNRDSISDDLLKLSNNPNIKVYEDGIEISLIRSAITKFDDMDLEDRDLTPSENATLYILDDGEVCYVNHGFFVDFGYSKYIGISGYEYKGISNKEQSIIEKLGKQYVLETVNNNPNNVLEAAKNGAANLRNNVKRQLMEKKKERLISLVKEAITKGLYEEKVYTYNPETKSADEISRQKAV